MTDNFKSIKRQSLVYWVAVFFIITSFLVVSLFCARISGQTSDESYYSAIGFSALKLKDYQFLGEHPPLIMQWGALPLSILNPNFPFANPVINTDGTMDITRTGLKFLYHSGNNAELILFLTRAMIVLLALFLGILVFCWGYSLAGKTAALAALLFYATSPNILTHASLYTTDLGVSLFWTSTFFFCFKYFKNLNLFYLMGIGVSLGLTLTSKLNGLIAIPAVGIIFLFNLWMIKKFGMVKGGIQFTRKQVLIFFVSNLALLIFCLGQKLMAATLGVICIISLSLLMQQESLKLNRYFNIFMKLFLNVCWFVSLISAVLLSKKMGWKSLPFIIFVIAAFFINAKKRFWKDDKFNQNYFIAFFVVFSVMASVIIFSYVDFPYQLLRLNPFKHFLFNVSLSLSHVRSEHFACIEGSFVSCDWRYFPLLFLIKTPFLTIFLFFIGLYFFVKKESRINRFLFLLPLVLYLFVSCFVNKIFIGIRHILPLYPFVFILCGYGVSHLLVLKNKVIRFLMLFLIVTFFSYHLVTLKTVFPHFITYFNASIRNIDQARTIVADSNINWGQDNKLLALWVKNNQINAVSIAALASNPDVYDYYGIHWSYLTEEEIEENIFSQGVYAIDIGIYQNLKETSVFKRVQPTAMIGTTYYIFKVNNKDEISN